MSKNSIIPFLKDYLINFLTSPFLLDTNDLKEDFSTNIRNTQLFLTDKNIYRSTRKFPTFTYLIFKETLVRFFHILR